MQSNSLNAESPELEDSKASSVPLPRPLRIFWQINIVLAVICAACVGIERYLLHRRYPYTSPFVPFWHWIDLRCFTARFEHFHHLDFFSDAPSYGPRFAYPAPAALLYEIFYVSGHPFIFFLSLTGILVLALGAILGRQMVRRGINPWTTFFFLASALLFSCPFWFEYLLGNLEICIFLIVAFGILAFLRRHFVLAAMLIGVAASMKIFPFVYFALFLSFRKYRELALGIVTVAVTNLVSLWLVCPSLVIACRGIWHGLTGFQKTYVLQYRPDDTGFDHSLLGVIKALSHHFYGWTMPGHLGTGYMICVSIAGLALYFLRIRFLPLLNQILCLSIASVLLPPISHEYTLIHLYVPWALMALYAIDQARANRTVDGLRSVFICFAILMSAEGELVYKGPGANSPHEYSGQLKAIMLVVLMVISLRKRFELPANQELKA